MTLASAFSNGETAKSLNNAVATAAARPTTERARLAQSDNPASRTVGTFCCNQFVAHEATSCRLDSPDELR